MMESDINGDINADCQNPKCHGNDCELDHPDCTHDSYCQSTDPVCEDNHDQCEETLRPSGGMMMKNKLMPMLANSVVLLAVITISGLVTSAQKFDRSLQTSPVINSAVITFGIEAIKDAVAGDKKIELARIIDPPDLT